MATHNFHSFNASELERNIEKLKETKHTCTFKLNLLRDVAASSPTHLPTFDNLENKLFNIAHQIYELEASDKERKKVTLSGIGSDQDADGHEIRTGLKGSAMLIGRLDDILEDIARLKFKLEDVTKGAVEAEQAGNQKNELQAPEAAQPMPNAGNVGAKGNKNENAAGAKVKEEETVPKKAKEVNWAPDGYHYVKAHFRKNPKRKQKAAAQPALDNGPASYEIVQVE